MINRSLLFLLSSSLPCLSPPSPVPSSKQSNLLRTSASDLIEDISPPLSSKPADHPPLLQPPPSHHHHPQHQVPLQQLNVTNVNNDTHLSSPPVNTNRLSPRYNIVVYIDRISVLLNQPISQGILQNRSNNADHSTYQNSSFDSH